jgi:hypothetical protein
MVGSLAYQTLLSLKVPEAVTLSFVGCDDVSSLTPCVRDLALASPLEGVSPIDGSGAESILHVRFCVKLEIT